MNQSYIFNETKYTHTGIRDFTTDLQYILINDEIEKNSSENVALNSNKSFLE